MIQIDGKICHSAVCTLCDILTVSVKTVTSGDFLWGPAPDEPVTTADVFDFPFTTWYFLSVYMLRTHQIAQDELWHSSIQRKKLWGFLVIMALYPNYYQKTVS